jgi:hypothetical protein
MKNCNCESNGNHVLRNSEIELNITYLPDVYDSTQWRNTAWMQGACPAKMLAIWRRGFVQPWMDDDMTGKGVLVGVWFKC